MRFTSCCCCLVAGLWWSTFSNIWAAAPSLVIEGCAVFDPHSGSLLEDQTVVTEGRNIQLILPASQLKEFPSGAEVIRGRGKFLIPGLIDAHVHVVHILDFAHMTGDEVLPLYLAAGVTSIRSTGDEVIAATLVARTASRESA